MSNFLNQLKIAHKEIFNAGINTMKTGRMNSIQGGNSKTILVSMITAGAIGSWFEYPEVATTNRVILGQTPIYSIIARDYLRTDNDLTRAIMYLIKRNIDAGILDEKAHLEESQNQSIDYTILNNASVMEASLKSKTHYESFINIYKETMLKRVPLDGYSLAALRDDMVIDFSLLQKNHRLIKVHYLDKIDSYTEEDVEIIIQALLEMKIDEEVRERVRKALLINIKKRNDKEAKRLQREQSTIKITREPQKIKQEMLSKKEYNLLYRELLSYYDMNNQKAIKPLTIKDVVYCVQLMLKLNIPETDIDKFIRNIDKENKKMENAISLYIALYDKIKHYAYTEEIGKKIALIEEYLQQIYICNDEDYEFWKESIAEELSELTTLIPIDGEYEKSEAKKLSKS